MKPTWMILAFAILVSLSSPFANAVGLYSKAIELSLQQVLENRESCIREICGDKIYLNADRISISEEGVYLQLNELGDFAIIPVLCSDVTGNFIPVSLDSIEEARIWGDWANNLKKTCPGCGAQYHVACPNQECPLKKKNKE